jgi:hypothetical protein
MSLTFKRVNRTIKHDAIAMSFTFKRVNRAIKQGARLFPGCAASLKEV